MFVTAGADIFNQKVYDLHTALKFGKILLVAKCVYWIKQGNFY